MPLTIGLAPIRRLLPVLCTVIIESCGGSPAAPTPALPAGGAALAAVEMEFNNVVGGESVRGTVSLTSAAPSGGALVTLASSDGAATVPASVRIAAGDVKGTFTVTTIAVMRDLAITISATTAGTPVTATVMIVARGALARLELTSDSVAGGQSLQGTLSLTSNAVEGGLLVTLSSDNEAAIVPASIMIPAGSSQGTFPVTTRPTSRDVVVTITASAAGSTRTARLTLVEAKLTRFDIAQADVHGPLPVRATLTFTGPPSVTSVRLMSSDPSAVTSSTVPVVRSGNTATLSINTNTVSSDKAVTLTVECCGSVQSAALRVFPMFHISDTGQLDLKTRHFFGYWLGFGVQNRVFIAVHPYNVYPDSGVSWLMAFGAPNNGKLVPGRYTDAHWSSEAGNGPSLDASSPEDPCLQAVGEFTVLEAVYGPAINSESGRLERFHATFRRQCSFGARSILSGEIFVTAPPIDYRDPTGF